MARTTETAVREILETEIEGNLQGFIDTANALVNQVTIGASYTEEYLEVAERWLAAHFAAIRDTRRASENVGKGVSESFQYKVGLNLNVTMYGQQAVALLPELAAQSAAAEAGMQKPKIKWLGKNQRR